MKSLLTIGVAVLTACVDAAVIEVKPCAGSATPAVAAALARLRDGDTLRFASGEYHFHEKGTKDEFLASVGSSTGMKKVVFYLEGLKDVTIDGGGSQFFFHGNTFPFAATRCDGLKIGGFTSRLPRLPIIEFTILEKGDDGFLCQFVKGHPPYKTKPDGSILFESEEGIIDSRGHELSVHALRYLQIQYITTPGCMCDKDSLASSFYSIAAKDRGGGKVFFRYFKDAHPKNAGHRAFALRLSKRQLALRTSRIISEKLRFVRLCQIGSRRRSIASGCFDHPLVGPSTTL